MKTKIFSIIAIQLGIFLSNNSYSQNTSNPYDPNVVNQAPQQNSNNNNRVNNDPNPQPSNPAINTSQEPRPIIYTEEEKANPIRTIREQDARDAEEELQKAKDANKNENDPH